MHEDLQDGTAEEASSSLRGQFEVGGIFFLNDARVKIIAPLGQGGEGKVFLGEILDGDGKGQRVVLKHHNDQLTYISGALARSHALREGPLAEIPDSRLARFLRPPSRDLAFLTYVEGQDMDVSLNSSSVPFIQRLARAEFHLIEAVSTLGAMHQREVVHGDVAHTNVVCSTGLTTWVDVGNLAQVAQVVSQGFRVLYAHPDRAPNQAPLPARKEYDIHAAGMLVLTAGISVAAREEYVQRHCPLGGDWQEVQQAKMEGRFVRLRAGDRGNLEDTAAILGELHGLRQGSSELDEAVGRLRKRFEWGLALLGQEPPVEAMRDPRQFVRSLT